MSPSPDRRRRWGADDGFTLIEVIVAMTLFMVVATAAAPVLVGGLRGAATARDITQAKAVAQGQLEKMRDMPFFVGSAAGDYKDVLDSYYRDRTAGAQPSATDCSSTTLSALPPQAWTGYVAQTATHCVWEPAGSLYRTVVPVSSPGMGAFSMVISTQFLSGDSPPTWVRPATDYTSHPAAPDGKDTPPASQVGVTVAVFYRSASGVHYTQTFTQIEQGTAIKPILTSESSSSTVRISSALNADTNLLQQLGVISLSGELYTGSRVVTTAAAATAGDSSGQQLAGARVNIVAPADQTSPLVQRDPQTDPTTGCDVQCFGKTSVDQASALSSNGLPRAGSAAAPVRAQIVDGAGNDGFRFANGLNGTRLKLDASKPMVSLDTSVSGSMGTVSGCAVAASPTTSAYLTATGYLDATSTTVSACGTAQSNTVRLFPTSFAPKGVVQIVLSSATASCGLSKSTPPAVSAGYTAQVRWKRPGDQNTYSPWLSLAGTQVMDALAAVDRTQTVNDTGLTLGDYISSWASLTSTQLKATSSTTPAPAVAEAGVPGAISIITQPTREDVVGSTEPHQADPASAISLTVGTVSCKVSDGR